MPIERPSGESANFGLADYLEAGIANFIEHLVRNTTLDPAVATAVVNAYTAGGGSIASTAVVENIATGAAYTLVVGDATKIKRGVDAAAQTINITTAFNGKSCTIEWLAGAGTITLDANAGVNLNGLGDGVNMVLAQAAGAVNIIPTGTNTFDVVGAIGDLLAADITDSTAQGRSVLTGTAAAGRTALAAPAAAQTFQLRLGPVDTVANKAYTAILKTAFACTVTNVTTKCLSGTATLTGAIDGVALGGTANAVSSTEVSQAHATANAMVVGTDLVFTASANAACLDMVAMVTLTVTLP